MDSSDGGVDASTATTATTSTAKTKRRITLYQKSRDFTFETSERFIPAGAQNEENKIGREEHGDVIIRIKVLAFPPIAVCYMQAPEF